MQEVHSGLPLMSTEFTSRAIDEPGFGEFIVGPGGQRHEVLQDASILHTPFVKGLGHNLPVEVSDSPKMLPSRAYPECACLDSDVFKLRLHSLLWHIEHISWVRPEPMQPKSRSRAPTT